jgi:membrane protein YqaA with SNARE-associated domain
MERLLVDWGLPALVGVSFLAATLLPVASEWLLAALVANGAEPSLAVGLATLGNTLGALTTWAVGLWGSAWLGERVLRIGAAERRRARRWYHRWGSWSLLLAWLPVVGDPLCLAAGLMREPLWRFTLLVAAGKAARYAAVAWAAAGLTA